MIIKCFGKNTDLVEDDLDKSQMDILIEPLISILFRSKENGANLTSLSIMAIVNMCMFVDGFKDIFIKKNGQ